jgi:NADPH-dependent glutamate synthase beta subunit-like oxidoreductase
MPEPGSRVTPIAVSSMSTRVTKTGSWKYIQPAYHDRVAPCNQACPVGIDIEGYLNLLREGQVEEACDLLVRENPMPAVTGRVCHHPCEPGCNRCSFDEGVAIHAIERQLGDLVLEATPRKAASASRGLVAVVGSGPAGLACAYHAARLGYQVTVYEAAPEAGGMLRVGIPAYRLPRAVLDKQIDWIRAHGVTIECGVRVGVEVTWANLQGAFDAIFVAPGAQQSRALDIPGEGLPGVESGLAFLRAVNGGARPAVGKHVVVVGGGNTAMDCARTALRLGAHVTVLYRRTRAEMPAIPDEVDDDGRVSAIECQRMKLGAPDASGRRRPEPVEGDRFTMPADTVLAAIGEVADFGSMPKEVERTETGVVTDEWGATRKAAIFAGGDATQGARTVADALGMGKRAAIAIDRYLRGLEAGGRAPDTTDVSALRLGPHGNVSITRWRGDDPVARVAPVNEVVAYEDLNVRHFTHAPRTGEARLSVAESRRSFDEVNCGLTREQALEEASRCFNCGVCNRCDICLVYCPDVAIARENGGYRFELDYCKGCGICAAECPRGAIAMTRDGL